MVALTRQNGALRSLYQADNNYGAFLEFVSERALGSNELSSHSLLGHRVKAFEITGEGRGFYDLPMTEELCAKLFSTMNKCIDDGTIWCMQVYFA